MPKPPPTPTPAESPAPAPTKAPAAFAIPPAILLMPCPIPFTMRPAAVSTGRATRPIGLTTGAHGNIGADVMSGAGGATGGLPMRIPPPKLRTPAGPPIPILPPNPKPKCSWL
uniref:Uncharacterized protein n=1 Tax=Anopheles melas TaxID=34690 RepID=A0A182U2I1_9DIPT